MEEAATEAAAEEAAEEGAEEVAEEGAEEVAELIAEGAGADGCTIARVDEEACVLRRLLACRRW